MISNWTTNDESDPLTAFLMLSDLQRAAFLSSNLFLRQKIESERERLCASKSKTFELRKDTELLTARQRQQCIDFLDAACRSTKCKRKDGTRPPDIKIALDSKDGANALAQMLGLDDARQIYTNLLALHPSDDFASKKIALRRTEGPVNGCIGFHCDGTCRS